MAHVYIPQHFFPFPSRSRPPQTLVEKKTLLLVPERCHAASARSADSCPEQVLDQGMPQTSQYVALKPDGLLLGKLGVERVVCVLRQGRYKAGASEGTTVKDVGAVLCDDQCDLA